MKVNFKAIMILALMPLVIVSCKKDNEEDVQPTGTSELEVKTVTNLFANNVDGHYTFFSLRTNSEVPLADSATDNWDVAFFSTKILTNSGTSGSGAGGAAVVSQAFDDVSTAPADSLFKTDNGMASLAIPTGPGNGWYNYDGATNVISPIAGRTLVIRTGDGKFAKMEILSYYKDAPAAPTSTDIPRYYKFRFAFQPNGSKTLK